ncbi:rhomboid family intramembrane serine protease [Gramella sp. AN32]|uniref:Rhomboid family intramembrane serine protease n=1 Tax=Christiangramia antarctica TaxID=2058158 RepID=A0ABW5X962_9FLAO|nr:rhomboid family intramembrane serine protease [Gramella sp. AN32]MCM4154441.1 rhomboid family intramembrane serine protease [Gramella sp. AN32]
MSTSERIKYKIKTATVTEKIIAVNVAVFVLFYLVQTIAYLFNAPANSILEWLVFSKEPVDFLWKPWSIITYGFMHGGFMHILFNMLILYFAGVYFLNYFSPKRLLNYYFLGIIIGGLVYMLSYNLFPVFQETGKSYLMGASAGVMAVLIGIATHVPNMRVRLLLIGSVKFWWIAAVLVVIDLIQIPFGNAGGHFAHLGGAALGYIYTTQLQKGNDIGKWFENILDGISGMFKSKPKQAKMKTVYRNENRTAQKAGPARKMDKTEKQQRIDFILDKISKSGYDSLTKAEKDFLFQAGKEN